MWSISHGLHDAGVITQVEVTYFAMVYMRMEETLSREAGAIIVLIEPELPPLYSDSHSLVCSISISTDSSLSTSMHEFQLTLKGIQLLLIFPHKLSHYAGMITKGLLA